MDNDNVPDNNPAPKNVEGHQPSTVSARKREANRNNAKKSTGPKTPGGKANSRFNALKHGLCAKRILFSPDGKQVDQDLLKLLQALQEEYGSNHVIIELLMESVVTEYWRQAQALKVEVKHAAKGTHFVNAGGVLHRYVTSSQRALVKNLLLLEKLRPQSSATDPKPLSKPSDPGVDASRKQKTTNGPKGKAEVIPFSSQTGAMSAEPATSDDNAPNGDDKKKQA